MGESRACNMARGRRPCSRCQPVLPARALPAQHAQRLCIAGTRPAPVSLLAARRSAFATPGAPPGRWPRLALRVDTAQSSAASAPQTCGMGATVRGRQVHELKVLTLTHFHTFGLQAGPPCMTATHHPCRCNAAAAQAHLPQLNRQTGSHGTPQNVPCQISIMLSPRNSSWCPLPLCAGAAAAGGAQMGRDQWDWRQGGARASAWAAGTRAHHVQLLVPSSGNSPVAHHVNASCAGTCLLVRRLHFTSLRDRGGLAPRLIPDGLLRRRSGWLGAASDCQNHDEEQGSDRHACYGPARLAPAPWLAPAPRQALRYSETAPVIAATRCLTALSGTG